MSLAQSGLVATAVFVVGCEQLLGVEFDDARLAMARCGDGRLDIGEACDDGNRVDADGCEANCTTPGCGNGIVDPAEACDDGNATNGDACDTNCAPPACRNGLVDPGELCFKEAVHTESNWVGSVGVADLDGDGQAEVITADNVWRWTGNGFAPVTALLGGGGLSIATSDLDDDGRTDVVVARVADVAVYHNLGGLEFQQLDPLASGTHPFFVAAGPVTGSLPDICVVSGNSNALYVLRNLGGMEFELSPAIEKGETPYGAAIADIDSDGDNDVAVTYDVWSDPAKANVTALRNDGGALTATSTALVAPGWGPNSIDAGDIDGDGLVDLMVANHGGAPGNDLWTTGSITVLRNTGDLGFQLHSDIPIHTYSHFAVIRDIDLDEDLDIVAALRGISAVAVIRNDGGELSLTDTFPAGDCPRHVAVGDINGDGVPDIVTADNPDDNFQGLSCALAVGSAGFSVLLSDP